MKVLATGVFDLLHVEHARFLEAAKKAGDRLIVGIESDKRAQEMKGPARPIIPENERLEMIRAIKFVDEAFIIRRDAGSSRMRNAVNSVSRMEEQEKAAANGREMQDILGCYKKLLQEIKPDIYAVSENSPHLETKKLLCQETGVEFKVVHPENPEVSTSKIIRKIQVTSDK